MTASIEAAVLVEKGRPVELRDVVLPEPRPSHARVRIVAAGVCHSDLHLAAGSLRQPVPAVLGHEGAGIVAELGDGVEGLEVGDHVVFNWSPSCSRCWHCEHGEPYHCQSGASAAMQPYAALVDGTPVYPGIGPAVFAQETVVPTAALIRIPRDFPPDQAALLGCAAMTGVGAVLNSARVEPGQSVCVIGLGGVGLSVVQGARLAGAAPIIAVDVSLAKEGLARSSGATHFLTASEELTDTVRELTGGVGADHVFEAVGGSITIRQAWNATRRGGRVTVLGAARKDDMLSLGALEAFYFGRTLAGCVYGSSDPRHDVPRLVDFARRGLIDLAALITDEIDLAGVPAAFERMARGDGARSIVRFR